MSGKLLIKARRDANKIMKGGFSDSITLIHPNTGLTIETDGLTSKHHINFDSDGLPINSKNVHVSLDEADLVSQNYNPRNSNNEVALINHLVHVKDSTGNLRNYVVIENFPDETLGLITCILGDYGTD
jgi:hypothetical protein